MFELINNWLWGGGSAQETENCVVELKPELLPGGEVEPLYVQQLRADVSAGRSVAGKEYLIKVIEDCRTDLIQLLSDKAVGLDWNSAVTKVPAHLVGTMLEKYFTEIRLPLVEAAIMQDEDILDALVSNGADLNGSNVLYHLAKNHDVDAIHFIANYAEKRFLDLDWDLEVIDENGELYTPLFAASDYSFSYSNPEEEVVARKKAVEKSVATIKALVEHGATLNQSLLCMRVSESNPEAIELENVRWMLDYASRSGLSFINELDPDLHCSALAVAEACGAKEMAALLREYGGKAVIEPEAYNSELLCLLAEYGEVEILSYLANYAQKNNISVDWDVKNEDGYSPLMLALSRGESEVVELFKGLGAVYNPEWEVEDIVAWQQSDSTFTDLYSDCAEVDLL